MMDVLEYYSNYKVTVLLERISTKVALNAPLHSASLGNINQF